MSGDWFEPTPWWDAEDGERPVPLGPEGPWAAPDEAELLVNAEREEIIREDTEPDLVTLAQLAAPARPEVQREGLAVSRSAASAAVALLLIGCVAMFVLGWNRGQEVLADRAASPAVLEPTSHDSANGLFMSSSRINQVGRKGGEE